MSKVSEVYYVLLAYSQLFHTNTVERFAVHPPSTAVHNLKDLLQGKGVFAHLKNHHYSVHYETELMVQI
jgi:hypothetical protein